MIVILIETTQGWLSLRALELAAGHAIFPAGSSLQGQATIGPELPFGPETVRCLNQGYQEGNPDRAQPRDLAEHAVRRMFVALRQQLPPGLSAQWLQIIQWLIQPLRPPSYPLLRHFLQPCTAVPRRIYLLPGTGDGPASI